MDPELLAQVRSGPHDSVDHQVEVLEALVAGHPGVRDGEQAIHGARPEALQADHRFSRRIRIVDAMSCSVFVIRKRVVLTEPWSAATERTLRSPPSENRSRSCCRRDELCLTSCQVNARRSG